MSAHDHLTEWRARGSYFIEDRADVAPPYGLTDPDLDVIVARSAAATTTADELANALHRAVGESPRAS